MAKKILKQSGYPTTDGKTFQIHKEAVKHQTDLDLIEACTGAMMDVDNVKSFLKVNHEIVSDYILKHLTVKPAPKQKPAKPSDKK